MEVGSSQVVLQGPSEDLLGPSRAASGLMDWSGAALVRPSGASSTAHWRISDALRCVVRLSAHQSLFLLELVALPAPSPYQAQTPDKRVHQHQYQVVIPPLVPPNARHLTRPQQVFVRFLEVDRPEFSQFLALV